MLRTSGILSGNSYSDDPATVAQHPSPSAPGWTLSEDKILLLNNRIYVPDVGDLRLRVLQYKLDHILSGHFGQNKTIDLVRLEYVWPNMRTFIKEF